MIVTLYRVYKGKMYSAKFIRQTRRYAAMSSDLGAEFEYRRVLTQQDCVNFCIGITAQSALTLARNRMTAEMYAANEVLERATAELQNLLDHDTELVTVVTPL